MLNGVGLNFVALNAARSAAFVLATANWSAEATVTSSADIVQSGVGTWEATLESSFVGSKFRFSTAEWFSDSVTVFRANTVWSATSGDWYGTCKFRAVHLTPIDAEPVSWEAGASVFTMEPDAILAFGGWVGTSSLESDTRITQPISASWLAEGVEFYVSEGDRERRTTVDFVPETNFNIEASTTNEDGALDQDAFTNWNAGATWFTDNPLNPIFVAYVDFETVKTDFKPVATLIADAKCSIEQNLYFDINATYTGDLRFAWLAKSDFTTEGLKVRPGIADWVADAVLYAPAWSSQLAEVSFVGTSDLHIDAPTQLHEIGDVQWTNTAFIDPIPTTRIRLGFVGFGTETDFIGLAEVDKYATADWYFTATTFVAAGIQTLVSAPDSRQFILSGKRPRMFVLSPGK
jgi:hypothetical protein